MGMTEVSAAGLEMRALTLKCFCEVAETHGIDGFEILRRMDIRPSDILNPERRLPAARVIKVLEVAASECSDDSFAIRMAEHRSFEDLGPISLLMQHLQTPRAVIMTSARLKSHYNDLLEVKIEENAGQAFITWDLYPASNARQAIDLGVALAYLLITGASGKQWKPDAIHLTHAEPANLGPWQRFFDCPIEFGSTFNGLSCSSAALSQKNPLASEVMADHATALLGLLPASAMRPNVRQKVEQRIVALLPEGRATLAEVADSMDMSPRKLQRQLAATGDTFSSFLDSIRLHKAKEHLAMSGSPIATVADMLGYTSPAAFSRWFMRQTGRQPSAWRSDMDSGVDGLSPDGEKHG